VDVILEPGMSRNAKILWGGTALAFLVVGIVVLLVK